MEEKAGSQFVPEQPAAPPLDIPGMTALTPPEEAPEPGPFGPEPFPPPPPPLPPEPTEPQEAPEEPSRVVGESYTVWLRNPETGEIRTATWIGGTRWGFSGGEEEANLYKDWEMSKTPFAELIPEPEPEPPPPEPEPPYIEPYVPPVIKPVDEIMSQVTDEAERARVEAEKRHTEALQKLSDKAIEERERVTSEVRGVRSDLERDFQAKLKEIRREAVGAVRGAALPSVVATMRIGQVEKFVGGGMMTAEETKRRVEVELRKAEKKASANIDEWFSESQDYLDKQREQAALGVVDWQDAQLEAKRAAIENRERAIAAAKGNWGNIQVSYANYLAIDAKRKASLDLIDVAESEQKKTVDELEKVDAETKDARGDAQAALDDRGKAQVNLDAITAERLPYLDKINTTYAVWKEAVDIIREFEDLGEEPSDRDTPEWREWDELHDKYREATKNLPDYLEARDDATEAYSYIRPGLDTRQSVAVSNYNLANNRYQESKWAADEYKAAEQAVDNAERAYIDANVSYVGLEDAVTVAQRVIDKAVEGSDESTRLAGFYAAEAESEVKARPAESLIVTTKPSVVVPKITFRSVTVPPVSPPRRWKPTKRTRAPKTPPPGLKGIL